MVQKDESVIKKSHRVNPMFSGMFIKNVSEVVLISHKFELIATPVGENFTTQRTLMHTKISSNFYEYMLCISSKKTQKSTTRYCFKKGSNPLCILKYSVSYITPLPRAVCLYKLDFSIY